MTSTTIEKDGGLSTAEQDGVLIVTLDRSPANAMSGAVIEAIGDLFARLAGTDDPPPVVITGAGERFFSAGGDIHELQGTGVAQLDARMRGFHRMLVELDRYPRPVVAAVNGYSVGGGLEYASFADVVLAVPHAQFGFPEIRHGLLPADKGIHRVIRLIGMKAARELLLTGELISSDRAARIGLIDGVVEPDRLLACAVLRAAEDGRRAPVLYAALKRSLNHSDGGDDQRHADVTLDNVSAYIDDAVAARLRDEWRHRP